MSELIKVDVDIEVSVSLAHDGIGMGVGYMLGVQGHRDLSDLKMC